MQHQPRSDSCTQPNNAPAPTAAAAAAAAATKVLDVHLTGCLAAEKILKENKKKEFLMQFAWRDGFLEFM